ncbi:GerAB/ArcD/ProY family transporter [Bacillus pseudomycoides]|uniref:GerAB/ArcD/ProY family transporter n=1 Tax=Bacillus pseudomycoides TaxID=64104 RepID=UPI001155701A|nr:GerAB/ArcD/ProY family transporter [Bacillus pseudomycoides]
MLFLILFMFFMIIILECISGIVQFQNLQPTLENGWVSLFKVLFPTTLTFPFGEILVFTMLFPYLKNRNQAKKVGIIAMIVSGLNLMLLTIMNIAVLGTESLHRSAFPILTAVSYINIAGFIQRIDTLIIIIMVILVFLKIAIYFFCAVIGATDLFRVKQSKKLIYPVGIIIVVSSIIIAPDYILHINEGLKIVLYYLSLPLQIVIPILLLVTIWIKKK